MAKDDDADDVLLPTKKAGKAVKTSAVSGARAPSPPMLRLIRIARALGVLTGGFVSLVGLMGLVGLVTEMFWVRLGVAVVVGVGVPALLADRALKRTKTSASGGLAVVVDVFAVVLLATALMFEGFSGVTQGMLRDEGDRHARSGSRVMARAVYFLAGVSPRFPGEEGWRGEGTVAVGPAPRAPDAGASDGGRP